MDAQIITRFEHEKLLAKDAGVDKKLISALEQYHGTMGTPYFTLIHQGVRFNQYVGVIRVGRWTVKVLPKVDRLTGDAGVWEEVLVRMLRLTKGFPAQPTSDTQLRVLPNSILHLYLELFISECEILTHQGLAKTYQRRTDNRPVMKGRLKVSEHIRHNLTHQERFVVEFSSYDQDHLINRILKQALIVINRMTPVPVLQNRVRRLLLDFEGIRDFMPTAASFKSIHFHRKNLHYKKAIPFARMTLLNVHPDISRGRDDVLALMFDMNDLWEQYAALQIRRHLRDRFTVAAQKSRVFWVSGQRKKGLRPDLMLSDRRDDDRRIIVDTKWKVPSDHLPGDEDLRQMFAYNHLFGCRESILLYPGAVEGVSEGVSGEYRTPDGSRCHVLSLNVLDAAGRLMQGREFVRPLGEFVAGYGS